MSGTIACESCGSCKSIVGDSRATSLASGDLAIRRRRLCRDCGERFTTFEISRETMERMLGSVGDQAVIDEVREAIDKIAARRGVDTRTSALGMAVPLSQVTGAQVEKFTKMVSEGFTISAAAARCGVSFGAAQSIIDDLGGATALRASREAAE